MSQFAASIELRFGRQVLRIACLIASYTPEAIGIVSGNSSKRRRLEGSNAQPPPRHGRPLAAIRFPGYFRHHVGYVFNNELLWTTQNCR